MKKITSKKCIALVLAITMLITSVPLMMVSAVSTGTYDPAPYWGDGSEYSAINTNFIATFNTDGSVEIAFPDAVPQKTYDGSRTKTIESYVFTLTKITEKGETDEVIYTENLDADAIRTGSGEYPNHIYYGPGGLESLKGYDVQSTYDVAIHAVDSDGWFSDKIHTLLTNIPEMDMEIGNSPNEKWVARLMLDFSQAGDAEVNGNPQSDDGFDGSRYVECGINQSEIDYLYNVNGIVNVDGQMEGMGYQGSSAYRYWISNEYTDTPFTFDTTWSRTHYNFENAEEVWFYVDFSRVNINKIAFTLKANEKHNNHYRNGSNGGQTSQYGDAFSTKAVGDINKGTITEGLYIQGSDGLWKPTSMTGGYFTELSGYEGFVRVPIDYFILQNDQYMTADNSVENWSESANEGNLDNYVNRESITSDTVVNLPDGRRLTAEQVTLSFYCSDDGTDSSETRTVYGVKINPAGTKITDAILMYQRNEMIDTGNIFNHNIIVRTPGKMLGSGNAVTVSGSTYTVTSGQYAIQDVLSAGFEVAEWSSDSVQKSFYFDQVMFCRHEEITTSDYNASTGAVTNASVGFPNEGLDAFAGDIGYVVGTYYDRTVEVPNAIANYILEYFGETPSLIDATAKEQVDKVIENCMDCFPGCSSVEDAIIYLRDTGGHTEAYNRYINAQAFLINYFNADDETRNQKAVEAFEKKVELLDDPDYADYNDEKLKVQLNDLMALYKSFNLSHFEILGEDEKDKFITLYKIIMGEEVKTGYSIGAYPFIPFNDFETNYKVGQLSHLYYDDLNREASMSTDVNNTKNLVTYITTETINQSAVVSGNAIGFSPADYRPTGDGVFKQSTNFSRMDAIISNKGFVDTQAATVRLHGDLTIDTTDEDTAKSTKKFAALSTTYTGANTDGSWSDLPSLNLSAIQLNDTTADGTTATDNTRYGTTSDGAQIKANSFVMYVDFSEVENIAMNVKFILKDSSGNDVNCYFCGGDTSATPTIYILDEKGDWTEVLMTASNLDRSSAYGDPGICSITTTGTALEGYKGFIRLPLSMFRIPLHPNALTVNYDILDNVLTDYTFKQVKVYFWDYDTNDVNIGKEIHIDAMGFTYDPENTARAGLTTEDAIVNKINSDNAITLKNMDEYFAVKTNDSVNFEKMVAEIDPYEGKEAFLSAYNEAKTAYDNLSFYQKGLDEIKHSYNDVLIGKYQALAYESGRSYETLMAQEPWVAKYTDTASLIADIDALSDTVKNYNVSGTNILDAYDSSDGGQVNYSALGIANETQAQEIIDMYEKGYCRLSSTNKALIDPADKTALENAYSAAKRAELIKGYVDDMTQFKQSIITIYTSGTAEPDVRMVKYSDTALKTALDDYDSMSVFAKQILTTTDDPAVAGYANMHAAAEAIYDNSVVINLGTQDNISGTLSGGIIIHENKLNSYVEPLRQKLANRELLNDPDDTFLKEIEYYLGQTENFMQRYAQVDEINVAYHALADQLAVADITSVDADGNALSTIYLDNDDATSATAKIDLTYIATRINKNVVLYVQSDLTWTQTEGPAYEAFKYYSYYDTKGSEEAGLITAPINNNYTNGNSSTISPYEYTISVDATEAAKVTNGAVYRDTITFYAVDPEVLAAKIAEDENDKYATPADVFADGLCILEKVDVDVVFESTNGADPLSYTVSIPAVVNVKWDETNAIDDVSYTVNGNLGSNELYVTISNDGQRNADDTAYVMINDDTGVTYTLDYITENFGRAKFTGTVTNGEPPDKPTITVTGWDKAPYGVYDTTLTYTASVN